MVLGIEVDNVEAAWGRGSLTKYFQNPGITEKGGGVWHMPRVLGEFDKVFKNQPKVKMVPMKVIYFPPNVTTFPNHT